MRSVELEYLRESLGFTYLVKGIQMMWMCNREWEPQIQMIRLVRSSVCSPFQQAVPIWSPEKEKDVGRGRQARVASVGSSWDLWWLLICKDFSGIDEISSLINYVMNFFFFWRMRKGLQFVEFRNMKEGEDDSMSQQKSRVAIYW